MNYPNLTKALVIGAAWFKFSETYLEVLKSMGIEGPGNLNITKLQNNFPDFIERMKTEQSHTDDPEYWQTLLIHISHMWWTPLDYSANDFQRISEPTLILMGDRDEFIPLEEAVEIFTLIPNAELAILPNATHLTALAEEGLFVKVVLDFLIRTKSQGDLN
jgi:pimeloyl-ACP methyl ester carboxylesterase